MKIALAQFNPTIGDFAGNSARILSLAEQARQRGAQLAVFSELCLCGYPPQDLLERPAFIDRNLKELKGLAAKLPLLPIYDVFDESRYFQPAAKQVTYDFGNEHLGITVCEDVWNDKNFWPNVLYDRDPVTELVGQGTSLLINISASPYTIDKRALRFEMLRSIAVTHRRPVVYVNQVGGNDSLIFDGASLALTADGKVAAQALAFEEDLILFDTVTGEGEIHE